MASKPSQQRTKVAKKPSTKKAAGKRNVASPVKRPARPVSGGDWREETLSRMRRLIFEADPKITEESKWRKPSNPAGVPTWSHQGIVCTGETYKNYVKLTFARGASLPDPSGLFNAGFAGGTRRAIDIYEGDKVDARAFKALIRAAVSLNGAH